MFRPILFFCCLLLAASIAAIYIFLIQCHSKDKIAYQQLLKESVELRTRKALEHEPIEQVRKGVQKDIWEGGKERLHFQLRSDRSSLSLTQKKGKLEAIENLQQIECLIQEAIDLAGCTQQLRRLRAEEGIYRFPSHSFSAETVHLAFYQVPGIELPASLETEKPFLKGIARTSTFGAANKTPTFNARSLRLQLDPQREIR